MANKKRRKQALSAQATAIRWIALVYFASGACSLIDEVVWVRLLKLTLGNTVYASSIVVSVFMGGLAFGAWLMAQRADRVRHPLRLYAILETLVTVTALAVPWLLKLADRFYIGFFRGSDPSQALLLVVQVLISILVLLVPSTLMGSTLPLLGRFVASGGHEAGRRVGRLYAWNTLGAATGCFLAGFVLIRAVGVMGTLYVAAALNVVVALAGWLLHRSGADSAETEPQAAATVSDPAPGTPRAPGRVPFAMLVAAFFLSGFVSIGYELLWLRSVVFLLGGFTYVFASVLTVYLLGNVIGTAIGSRLLRRIHHPASAFAVSLGFLGLCGLALLPVMVVWTRMVADTIATSMNTTWLGLPVVAVQPIVHSLVLFLVPSIAMGIGFPIALQAWNDELGAVGRSTGSAYAANTIGAVLGGLLTGFVLLPLLGVQQAISVLGLVALGIGGAVWYRARRPATVASQPGPAVAVGLLTVLVVIAPIDWFEKLIEASPEFLESFEMNDVIHGVTTTVSVHTDTNNGSKHLFASGQSVAGDTLALRGDQKALGHFGALLHAGAREVLSVGFGSGETTKCLADHDLDVIDCVEISPEVVEMSLRHFTHLNLGERLDDEVDFVFMDAKNYLHLTDRQYDLIVNDSIHPRDFSDNASLYNKDYFEAARDRLKPRGLFISWLPTYHMNEATFDSIIGSQLAAFPHVSLWYLTSDPAPLVLLIGSSDPQQYSVSHVEAGLSDPDIRDSLAVMGIRSAYDLFGCHIADETALRQLVEGARMNSDDRPFVEFHLGTWVATRDMFRRYVLGIHGESILDHLEFAGFAPARQETWLAGYRRHHLRTAALVAAIPSTNELEQLKLLTDALADGSDDPRLQQVRDTAEARLLLKGRRLVETDKMPKALEMAALMLRIHPGSASAWLVRAEAAASAGNLQQALVAANQATQLDPESDAAREMVVQLEQRERFERGTP